MILKRLSAKNGIALQLAFIVISVFGLSLFLKIAPNPEMQAVEGRSRVASTLAMSGTTLLSRRDPDALKELLNATVATQNDLKSIGLRTDKGQLVLAAGDHSDWQVEPEANGAQYQVPIFAGDKRWGTLELRYTPLTVTGWKAIFWTPWTPTVLFLGTVLFLVFRFYIGKVIHALDPSKVVPTSVRSALDTLAEGLLVLDHSGRIALANQAFAKFVNKSPESLVGKRAEVIPWITGDEEGIPMPWTLAMRDERPVANVMLQLEQNGVMSVFNVNCSPVLGHGGKYRGVLVSFDDVTLLEQNKRELRSARDAAESASRAKSEFLANMSHEIRTPMNAILGFTDVLRRGLAESRQHAMEYLNTIHSSGKHLLDLINDILDLSKVEAGRMQIEILETRPHDIIHDVVSVLGVKAREKGVFLEYNSNGAIPELIQSDPTRLRQIVTNLVGNAIKFTEKGGVKVTAGFHQEVAGESSLTIDVTDTGVGMSTKVLGNVFEPFVQADTSVTRKFGGTGLGLAISRKFARAMGGDIIVTSELGRGSTFSVRIPAGKTKGVRFTTAEDAIYEIRDRQQTRSENPLTIQLKTCRILVVDDGEANRQLLSVVLRRAGAMVELASNGQEAVDVVALRDFDLILMDMQMPLKDGYTATREIRGMRFKKPIIALTGNAMNGDEEKCLKAGCSDFLTKPVDIDVLLERLAAIVGRLDADAPSPTPSSSSNSIPLASTPVLGKPTPESGKPEAPRKAASAGLRIFAQKKSDPDLSASSRSTVTRPPLISRLPMDDPEFRDIVQNFVSRLEQELKAIDADLAASRFTELAKRAHWLKGAGGTVGFPEFTDPARRFEDAAKKSNPQALHETVSEIRELAGAIFIPPQAQELELTVTTGK
jgi:PAS domain S-box-containing protein